MYIKHKLDKSNSRSGVPCYGYDTIFRGLKRGDIFYIDGKATDFSDLDPAILKLIEHVDRGDVCKPSPTYDRMCKVSKPKKSNLYHSSIFKGA